jgi:hypothetical protein
MKFTPVANCYVIRAEFTEGTNTYITYKVVKIENGSADKSYTITPASASIANNGSTTFTIANSQTGADGNVTGAKGAIVIVDEGSKVVNDLFTITEAGTNPYTYTITANAPGGEYTVSVGGASTTITVETPEWTTDPVYVEEGKTATNVIKDKTGGALMAGITPIVTPQSGAKGKLTASETNASGETTLSPAAGSYGTFKVAYHGAEFTVQVDKYSITADRNIINVGDTDHDNATLTLANANASGSDVKGKEFTSSNTSVADTKEATSSANTVEITALGAGTTTYSYKNAKCDIEVVNYELTNNDGTKLDGLRTIKLTKDGEPIDGATFTATAGTVQSTTTAGVYKVTGTAATTISFKYKNVVVADITLAAE